MSTNQNLASRPTEAVERMEQKRTVTPPVDIFENANEILLVADVPGAGKEDVSLHFEKDTLTLRASGAVEFLREFSVGSGIDVDKTEASVQQGVLRVRLPKSAALQARTIKVKAG